MDTAPRPRVPTGTTRVVSVAVLVVLLAALVHGLLPDLDTRLVQLGERIWPGYAADLRVDPRAPDCDPEAIARDLAACAAAPAGSGAADPAEKVQGAGPSAGTDPVAEADPFAAPAADPPAGAPGFACAALPALRDQCLQRHADHASAIGRITPAVRAFRRVEGLASDGARLPAGRYLLAALVLLGGLVATVQRRQVALRKPSDRLEARVASAACLLANLLLAVSCAVDARVQRTSGATLLDPWLVELWTGGFAVLACVDLVHLVRPSLPPARETLPFLARVGALLASIPLFAWLGCVAGAWFLLAEGHPSGQAIYLHKFSHYPSIYTGVGLYVWAGMLFSVTRLAPLAFGLLRPLRLPPPILCWLTGVASAFPTATSGASGIFVIAAGREIHRQLRAAGTSRRLALAATAMSGSLGVVLRPCLLVVLVATLNKQVTTDDLYRWGLGVFALTSALYLVAVVVRARAVGAVAPTGDAIPSAAAALRALLPYLAVGGAVLVVLGFGLGTWPDEFSAPLLLPVALIGAVAWESRRAVRDPAAPERRYLADFRDRLLSSAGEAAGLVGALLLLMVASVALGGVVERADVMAALPALPGSRVGTMVLLVAAMVGVGMIMDAMGAVILVSATLSGTALAAGIAPMHFWMMVLVAFELGYLTPPVALNQLLAREAVGSDATVPDDDLVGRGLWARHEDVLLPVAVMGVALLLVAFVPFLFYPA